MQVLFSTAVPVSFVVLKICCFCFPNLTKTFFILYRFLEGNTEQVRHFTECKVNIGTADSGIPISYTTKGNEKLIQEIEEW